MAKFNHIGIAIEKLDCLKKLFKILDLKSTRSEQIESQGLNAHFFEFEPSTSYIELLESITEESVINKFINTSGPGIHHIAIELPAGQLEVKSKILLEEGFVLLFDRPKTGPKNSLVNFIHPKSCDGVLIEILEKIIS